MSLGLWFKVEDEGNINKTKWSLLSDSTTPKLLIPLDPFNWVKLALFIKTHGEFPARVPPWLPYTKAGVKLLPKQILLEH